MGYTVNYLNDGTAHYKKSSFFVKRLKVLITIIAISSSVTVFCFRPNVFVPGNADITKYAFRNFFCEIKAGVSPAEAFYDFCTQILRNET